MATRADRRNWTRADVLAVAAIATMGAVVRFARLGNPPDIVFDETYYAKDACWYAETSASLCGIGGDQTAGVHPPLGKWLIATGIKLFGFDSFGWRAAAALAGVLTIIVLYVLARRLFLSTVAASLTAGLLALDFLHFVQSRIAMLDVFVPLFGLLAVLFLVIDRDQNLSGRAPPGARPWRVAAGAAAGAATAAKWSGAFFVLLVIGLAIVWKIAARRANGANQPPLRAVKREWGPIVLSLVVVPLLVYGLTFVGQVHGNAFGAPWSEGTWTRAWWDQQVSMADFHVGLEATHLYQSPSWSWVVVRRPVSYFYETNASDERGEILALGNPIVWWASIPALAFVAYRWWRRRDYRGPEGVILAGFLVTYGPWLVQQTDRSAVFLFYLLPSVPFMCLAIGYAARALGSTWEARAAAAIAGGVVVASFGFFYPVMANVPLPEEQWNQRIWYQSCDRSPARTTTSTEIETRPRATITRTNITTLDEAPPPDGWCWI
jgi:dolichyl-phosphate-mannose-protein mannosyltransferase